MITEDYVSFEVAKLLKEKGFNCITYFGYRPNGAIFVGHWENWENGAAYPKTTLQMAKKWLRKVHHIYISISFEDNNRIYHSIKKDNKTIYQVDTPKSYEEIIEEDLIYYLKYLI